MNTVHWLVDRIHVGTPDAEVEADMRGRCERAGRSLEDTAEIIRVALERHHDNLAEYRWVMGGLHD